MNSGSCSPWCGSLVHTVIALGCRPKQGLGAVPAVRLWRECDPTSIWTNTRCTFQVLAKNICFVFWDSARYYRSIRATYELWKEHKFFMFSNSAEHLPPGKRMTEHSYVTHFGSLGVHVELQAMPQVTVQGRYDAHTVEDRGTASGIKIWTTVSSGHLNSTTYRSMNWIS